MKYVKFCPHCANISWPSFTEEEFKKLVNNNDKTFELEVERQHAYYNNICCDCKNNLIETAITVEEYANYIGYNYSIDKYYREPENEDEYTEINKKIFNEYIKPLNLLDENSEYYIDNMLTFCDVNLYSQPTYTPTPTGILMAQQMAQNKPKCPVCGSTNLKKLSAINRSVSFGVFGFASNKIGKTYECQKCKATF